MGKANDSQDTPTRTRHVLTRGKVVGNFAVLAGVALLGVPAQFVVQGGAGIRTQAKRLLDYRCTLQ